MTPAFPLKRPHRWHEKGEIWGVGHISQVLGGGFWSSEEKLRLKYTKFESGAFNGAAMDGALAGHARSCGYICGGSPLGIGSSKGPGTRETTEGPSCAAGGNT